MHDPILQEFAPEKLKPTGGIKSTPPVRSHVNLPRGYAADPALLKVKIHLAEEQARKIEIANQKSRGELLLASAVEREWSSVLHDLKAALLALPSRLQLSAKDTAAVDTEIRAILAELTGDA